MADQTSIGRIPLQDAGWYDALAAGLAAEDRDIHVGRMASDWPTVTAKSISRGPSWLRVDLMQDGSLALSTLLLCGVERRDETEQLRAFNATAGLHPRGMVRDGWLRPYRGRERPLCVSVWLIDKNDPAANNTANFALQAVAAAYFRSRWVA